MPIAVRLPGLDDWKAQVKCQMGCPPQRQPPSLAFLRFTRGPAGAALALATSIALWIAVPLWLAARRLERVDLWARRSSTGSPPANLLAVPYALSGKCSGPASERT